MGSIALYRHSQPQLQTKDEPACARPGLFRRIFAALERARQRSADREVARFIAGRGGRLTDEVERQLIGRFNDLGGSR